MPQAHATPARSPFLSKSRYIAGQQCHLRLWYDEHQRELQAPVSGTLQAVFDQGHAVGELATQRFPGGVLVEEKSWPLEPALERTATLMARRDVPAIFEAAFVHADTLVRVDILERAKKGRWNLIEVKSTGSVKPTHVEDAAVQTWVARGAGVKIDRVYVCTLNTSYVYDGVTLDLEELFTLHDVTEKVEGLLESVSENVPVLLEVLSQRKPPEVEPGPHCEEPYECPYLAHCTRDLEPTLHDIAELPHLRADKAELLRESGIVSILDLNRALEDFALTSLQERVRDAVTQGAEFVGSGLRAALSTVTYPIHYLDFETFGTAVPRYAGTRPFQFVPFQWSNHIEDERGTLRHDEFLSEDDRDPREALAHALLASLGSRGTICTYSSYERRVITELATALPKYKRRLEALLPRLWDLLPIVREHYYHPEFHGSFSIKSVLPAVVPELTYDDLAVADGMQAGVAYLEAITTADPTRKSELLGALRDYCGRDSLAMLEVRRALLRKSQFVRGEDVRHSAASPAAPPSPGEAPDSTSRSRGN